MTRFSEHYHIEKKSSRFRGIWRRLSWRGVVLGTFTALSALYVVQTTAISVTGYDMGDLERQKSVLKRDAQALEVQIAQYRSMSSIQERLASLKMVNAADISYVNRFSAVVARR
jgi:hypothetical protein